MNEDKIIEFKRQPMSAAVPEVPVNAMLFETHPCAIPPTLEGGSLGFEDIDAAFNMRSWLQRACEASGAKMTGGGMGMGCADLWIELEGHEYMVTIKPVTQR